jgi:hypothetical protein
LINFWFQLFFVGEFLVILPSCHIIDPFISEGQGGVDGDRGLSEGRFMGQLKDGKRWGITMVKSGKKMDEHGFLYL